MKESNQRAFRTVRVRVETRHIAEGTPNNGSSCPVYLALWEAGLRCLHVGTGYVLWPPEIGGGVQTPLPNEAFEWVCDFDAGRPVDPLAFQLQVPHAA